VTSRVAIAKARKPPGIPVKSDREPTRSSADSIGELMARYPDVQLATLVDVVPEGANWVHEIKFDGYRLLGFRLGQTVRLITRNGKDWTGSFPALSVALSGLGADEAVLDMEAVVLDGHGKSNFQSLQNALGDFDLLYLNGKDLTPLPLLEQEEARNASRKIQDSPLQ
jgi:bifunctional non-homologous end joining protein LigD